MENDTFTHEEAKEAAANIGRIGELLKMFAKQINQVTGLKAILNRNKEGIVFTIEFLPNKKDDAS